MCVLKKCWFSAKKVSKWPIIQWSQLLRGPKLPMNSYVLTRISRNRFGPRSHWDHCKVKDLRFFYLCLVVNGFFSGSMVLLISWDLVSLSAIKYLGISLDSLLCDSYWVRNWPEVVLNRKIWESEQVSPSVCVSCWNGDWPVSAMVKLSAGAWGGGERLGETAGKGPDFIHFQGELIWDR